MWRRLTCTRNRRRLIIGGLFVVACISIKVTWFPSYVSMSQKWEKFPMVNSQVACRRPELDLNDPAIMKHFRHVPPLTCNQEDNWVCVEGSSVRLCNATTRWNPRREDVKCRLRFIERVDDHENREVGTADLSGDEVLELQSDVFHVQCTGPGEGGSVKEWQNLMSGFARNHKIWEQADFDKAPKEGLGLNVLIFGYDSLSRLTFMRKLPRTFQYLTEELGAVVLKGYNIVGDGTPQALIPIFTGQTERELPETRKRMVLTANYVNVYPFVWNDFAKLGYVTAYAEDGSSIGTFTYRLKGFKEQPTHHYGRPFYIESLKILSQHKQYCFAGTPRHKVMMNWVENYFDYYSSVPKFMFAFHSELSHDDINLVELADEDNVNMLKSLKRKGHLDNSMLVILCDHGNRFAEVRETQQGKLEERLPFVAVSMPDAFKKAHPKAWENLLLNSERLTSPFDLYPTLRSVLFFDGEKQGRRDQRGISLFNEVPLFRSCADADIEPHWCTCLSWEPMAINATIVKRAAQTFVDLLNNMTYSYRHLCHKLQVQEIMWASRYVPNEAFLRFRQNADYDGFVGDFSANTKIRDEYYQLKVHTEPGNGHFEVTVRHLVQEDKLVTDTKELSRVNVYGHSPDCIINVNMDLLRFCYCKSQNTRVV